MLSYHIYLLTLFSRKPLCHQVAAFLLLELAMQYQPDQRVIQMALTLLEKQMKQKPVGFNSTVETLQYLRLQLEQLEREVFMVLYLDNQHRLIASEVSSQGTINATSVYPREIIKAALSHNAAAVILAHNHPSGMAEPSHADRAITNTLMKALLIMDIKVLDHVIIGHGESISFAERGWL